MTPALLDFRTEDILMGACQDMHSALLKFFQSRDFEQTEEIHDRRAGDQLLHQANELSAAPGFAGIRRRAGVFEALAFWR